MKGWKPNLRLSEKENADRKKAVLAKRMEVRKRFRLGGCGIGEILSPRAQLKRDRITKARRGA
jgi:hypothetical protein